MDGSPPAIVVEGLGRRFGQVRAVEDLTFEVPRGTLFGFLGPNGAGKTTTINLLLGLLEPSSGRVEVLGLDPVADGDAVRARTGAVLEHPGIYEHLSAWENLEFYGRVARLPAEERRARMRELLEAMGLLDRRDEKAGSWSRGMQQRLALARALLHRPPLLFLDEPTAGLDVLTANAVRQDLVTLAAAGGTTIFLTTHNMVEAERVCSRVAVIRAGRLVALGSPDELRGRAGGARLEIVGRRLDSTSLERLRACPGVADAHRIDGRLVLDLDGDAEGADLVRVLVESGAEVEEVRRERPTLEEVFVTLMEEER
jgi:ABC-2 type transport system ATP-binding protein